MNMAQCIKSLNQVRSAMKSKVNQRVQIHKSLKRGEGKVQYTTETTKLMRAEAKLSTVINLIKEVYPNE